MEKKMKMKMMAENNKHSFKAKMVFGSGEGHKTTRENWRC